MSGLGELRAMAVRRQSGENRGRPQRSERSAYVFLTPWLIGIVGITILPILASLYLSFTDYRLPAPA